jgi:hypothetical protein
LPVNDFAHGIALLRPRPDLVLQHSGIADASIQALPTQYTEFDFGPVEPTAVFGRVVELKPFG